jgi:hypothetical protein
MTVAHMGIRGCVPLTGPEMGLKLSSALRQPGCESSLTHPGLFCGEIFSSKGEGARPLRTWLKTRAPLRMPEN